jgi:hypothetical protein
LSPPGLNGANPNPELPRPLLDEDPLLVDDGNGSNNDGGDNAVKTRMMKTMVLLPVRQSKLMSS